MKWRIKCCSPPNPFHLGDADMTAKSRGTPGLGIVDAEWEREMSSIAQSVSDQK